MDKTFDFSAVERRIAAYWEQTGAFRAGRAERAEAEPFCIVIPPPNVTGNLHMGHALNNTLQDVLCRYWRMKGRDVLWQPGIDHAGIATQMVVERQLAAKGEDRRAMGRQAFLDRVWEWKAESGGAIVGQLKRLGASCDWSRERFTLDEGLSKAVAKVFVQLYREGLIYRDKRLVNWDPKFQTAISDLEVQQIECKGSFKWSRAEGEPLDEAALAKALAKNPERPSLPFRLSAGGRGGRGDRRSPDRRDDAARDHARRYGRRRASRRRALHTSARPQGPPAAGRAAHSGRRRRIFRSRRRARARSRSRRRTTSTISRSASVTRPKACRPINILDAEARVTLDGNVAFFEGVEAGRSRIDAAGRCARSRRSLRRRA